MHVLVLVYAWPMAQYESQLPLDFKEMSLGNYKWSLSAA